MRNSVYGNQETTGSFGRSAGRSSIVALAAIAILGISTVSGSLLYQWQRSGTVGEARVDPIAEQNAKAALEGLGFLTTHDLQTGHVEYVSFLGCGNLDEAALNKLAALPHIVALDLGDCSITDEQLRYVSGLSELSCLQLDGNPIGDEGLAHLGPLHKLRQLFLRGTKVSNEGLPMLARMPQLNTLDFKNTPVTEGGLKHLRDMPKLRWLLLTEITDAGVPHLMEMQNLKRLSVNRNKVSEAKLEQLKKAIPKVVIHCTAVK